MTKGKRQRGLPRFELKPEYYLVEFDFQDEKKQRAFNKDRKEFWARLTGKRTYDLSGQSSFSTINIEEIAKSSPTHKIMFLYDLETANKIYELALKHDPVLLNLRKATIIKSK